MSSARRSVLTDPLFSPFRLIVFRSARLAFVLNPKVGSTFLRDMLADGLRDWAGRSDPSEGRYGPLKKAREMPVAPLRDYWHFLGRPGEYRIHSIVRNPYARLASAWRDKFLDGHLATPDGATAGYPRSMRQGELAKARAFARDNALPGAEDGRLLPFETFVAYAAAQPPGRRNHHWEDQWRIILWERLPYTSVFRMEDGLAEPLAEALAPLGFDPDWVRSRAARPANPSSAPRSELFTPELAATARRIYARDLELFGYAPDSWRGL